MARHVRKSDVVLVIAGDQRGARGKVLSVDVAHGKVVVEGVNRVQKHVKPSRKNPQGGRVQVEKAIAISNVMRIHPKSGKPTRVRYGVNAEGQKMRLATDGQMLEVVSKKKA